MSPPSLPVLKPPEAAGSSLSESTSESTSLVVKDEPSISSVSSADCPDGLLGSLHFPPPLDDGLEFMGSDWPAVEKPEVLRKGRQQALFKTGLCSARTETGSPNRPGFPRDFVRPAQDSVVTEARRTSRRARLAGPNLEHYANYRQLQYPSNVHRSSSYSPSTCGTRNKSQPWETCSLTRSYSARTYQSSPQPSISGASDRRYITDKASSRDTQSDRSSLLSRAHSTKHRHRSSEYQDHPWRPRGRGLGFSTDGTYDQSQIIYQDQHRNIARNNANKPLNMRLPQNASFHQYSRIPLPPPILASYVPGPTDIETGTRHPRSSVVYPTASRIPHIVTPSSSSARPNSRSRGITIARQLDGYASPKSRASVRTEERRRVDDFGFVNTFEAASRPYTPDKFLIDSGVAGGVSLGRTPSKRSTKSTGKTSLSKFSTRSSASSASGSRKVLHKRNPSVKRDSPASNRSATTFRSSSKGKRSSRAGRFRAKTTFPNDESDHDSQSSLHMPHTATSRSGPSRGIIVNDVDSVSPPPCVNKSSPGVPILLEREESKTMSHAKSQRLAYNDAYSTGGRMSEKNAVHRQVDGEVASRNIISGSASKYAETLDSELGRRSTSPTSVVARPSKHLQRGIKKFRESRLNRELERSYRYGTAGKKIRVYMRGARVRGEDKSVVKCEEVLGGGCYETSFKSIKYSRRPRPHRDPVQNSSSASSSFDRRRKSGVFTRVKQYFKALAKSC